MGIVCVKFYFKSPENTMQKFKFDPTDEQLPSYCKTEKNKDVENRV